MTAEVRHGMSLWDAEDGFFYDALHFFQFIAGLRLNGIR